MSLTFSLLAVFFLLLSLLSLVWPRFRRRSQVRTQEDKMILSVIYLHQVEIRRPADRWKRRSATIQELSERLPKHLGYGHPLTAESELLRRVAVLEKRGLVGSRTVQQLFENPTKLYWVTQDGLRLMDR